MLSDKITLLISSCEAFSDLWDAHMVQLEKNWHDRDIKTYILTDSEHAAVYENAEVMSAGDSVEFSERLKFALERIDTEFIFFTLDDYFLMKPVSNDSIAELVSIMEKEKLDYLRLFKHPQKANAQKVIGYKYIRKIDTQQRYSVNLYAGIWRRDFMLKTIRDVRDPWRFEVSLSHIASELEARCAVDLRRDFVILDVVRKGKILNKASRYLKKHSLYHGPRPVQSRFYEFKLFLRTMGARHMPRFVVNAARNFMIKRGHHYYSQEE